MTIEGGAASASLRWGVYILGSLVALAGLFLAVGGAYLAALGGSGYFVLTGIALLASGVLIVRRKPAGAWIYGAALIVTVLWAPWDAGWEF
jgi:quinate dehydrogenase (quinone)